MRRSKAFALVLLSHFLIWLRWVVLTVEDSLGAPGKRTVKGTEWEQVCPVSVSVACYTGWEDAPWMWCYHFIGCVLDSGGKKASSVLTKYGSCICSLFALDCGCDTSLFCLTSPQWQSNLDFKPRNHFFSKLLFVKVLVTALEVTVAESHESLLTSALQFENEVILEEWLQLFSLLVSGIGLYIWSM